jgi:para-nitrobenzyl esterase
MFGNVGKKGAEAFAGSGPEAERLRDRIMDAWIAFARGGDPSHPDLGTWPPYDGERRATMILDAACTVDEDPLSAERRAWDGVL